MNTDSNQENDLFNSNQDDNKSELINRSQKDLEAQADEKSILGKGLNNQEINQDTDKNLENSKKLAEVIIQETLEDRIETRVLEEAMQDSYLSYAMSVIVSRALPDVRDGMKPVHRRILYTMYKLGLTPGAKYVKCARVIGDVLGKYHPHGDLAVYGALVRLAQDFSLRYPLIDGQGNFGSIDGDSAAAHRYTEARMTAPSIYLLKDIEKDTVDYVDNYDGSTKEPKVLPALLPNLLINGQTGIAVGMATEIPPHNLEEVCNASLHLLDNPDATIDDLLNYIKGPDLPTGGTIFGQEEMIRAYHTGRGRCAVRAEAELEEARIIVTEIPYQVNKSDLLQKIASLVKDKKLEGIRDVRDESNKEGIRVVIETKRDASPEVVLNQLYIQTDLQTWQHFNMLALVKDGKQPKLLNLKEILVEYLNHRDIVVVRRTKYDLNKNEAELHILDGLKIALDFIDDVISLIRASYDKLEASTKLQATYKLTEIQADAILQMRLQALTNLDRDKLETDRQSKIEMIKQLKEILENPAVKKSLIASEIEEVRDKFNSPRRSRVVAKSIVNYSKEDVVEEQEVIIQLTNSQYIKVVSADSFRTQGRGGRGVQSFNPKDEDWVKQSLIANSHDYVYAFTSLGRVFRTRVFDLPAGTRQGRGQALINYFQLQKDELVSSILTISKDVEKLQEGSLIFTTTNGLVKRTNLEDFANIRKTGIIAIGLNEDDRVLDVSLSLHEDDKIILSGSSGKTVIFDRSDLNPLGRTAKGVKGIKLPKKETVVSLQISRQEFAVLEDCPEALLDSDSDSIKEKNYPSILVITQKGYGKQTSLSEYRKTKRAASGVKTLNMTSKTGKPVFVQVLYGQEENLFLTTKNGITIRLDPEKITQLGRVTQGVKIIKLEKGDYVVGGGVN